MRIMQAQDIHRLPMWGNMRPTRGAFLTCMEMSGSGPRTGTRLLIRLAIKLVDLSLGPIRSTLVPGIGRGEVPAFASWHREGTAPALGFRVGWPTAVPGAMYGFRVSLQKSQ